MRYNFGIRLTHKIIALFVILQLIVGLLFDALFSHFYPGFFMTLHKSMGLSLLFLIILLMLLRLVGKKIPYPKDMPTIQIILAKLVHFLLYLCVLGMSLTGFIASELFHSKWQFFYLFDVPAFLPANPALGKYIFSFHGLIAPVLLTLVILHIAAAIYHRSRKDTIMKKMF